MIAARPLLRSVVTTCRGMDASSSRSNGTFVSSTVRSESLEMKWLLRPSSPAALISGLSVEAKNVRKPLVSHPVVPGVQVPLASFWP